MLITDKKVLREYSETKRLWQGIPSIEVTEKGRVFLTFYSGGTREEIGNFSLLFVSDDGGKTFDEPIAVAYEEGCRCFDPCLWIDPLGRLWFTWAKYPDDGEFAVICNDPDAETLVFGEPFRIGRDVMMNKPTVLSSGEWLFPIAVWKKSLCKNYPGYGADITDKGAYVYMTEDQGRSFQKLGFVDAKKRSADEHMLLELQERTLRMFIRTDYGIAAADSHDGGITWSEDYDSGYGGPCSRFHIRRLASGRILLINHYEFDGRNNLTAMLSEDEGKTFFWMNGMTFPIPMRKKRTTDLFISRMTETEGLLNGKCGIFLLPKERS